MPWTETCAVDQRLRFVMEYELGEEPMAVLCQQYGISRKTGYKWLGRFLGEGPEALKDRSRAPRHHPNEVCAAVEQAILSLRGEHPRWGPKKLRVVLQRDDGGSRWPAASTIGEVLNRHGLTIPRKRRRRVPPQTKPFASCDGPNAVWCADFKGWFRTQDGARCDPLTISDGHSRYLLRCQAMTQTGFEGVGPLFEAAFRQYGLPGAIRTDNGAPFAGQGPQGLSRLSVWWIKLGIVPERIDAGHPEQNGRHERMHGTLKRATASPPARTLRAQQRRFDGFRQEYNEQRPHEALGMRTPSSVYCLSTRRYPERIAPFAYGDMAVRRVRDRGDFRWHCGKVYLSKVLIGECVGLEPLDGRHWTVHFGPVLLGIFDSRNRRMLTRREIKRLGMAEMEAWARPFRSAPGPCPSP